MDHPVVGPVVVAYQDSLEAYSSRAYVSHRPIRVPGLVEGDHVGDGLSSIQAVRGKSEDIFVPVVGVA